MACTIRRSFYLERGRSIDPQDVSLAYRLKPQPSGRISFSGRLKFASKGLQLIKPGPPDYLT